MIQNPAKTYQNNQVTTATPSELTLMLYNGAIKFIRQAKNSIGERQFAQAHEANIRVQDILNELIITLNRDIPISKQFMTMYEYMMRRLIEANLKKSTEILNEVEDLFIQFRDTWKEAMKIAKQQG